MASTAASNLTGAWFGELASALQGTWQGQAAAATHGHGEDRQQKLARGGDGASKAVPAVREKRQQQQQQGGGDVVRYGGAMSDTTLYMLLDRVAPS